MLGQLTIAAVCAALATALVGVFAVSGFAKVGRADQTLRSMAQFGVAPGVRRRSVALALAFGELALALGLLAAPGLLFTAVAVGAALLLAVFVVLTARVLVRGDSVECNCFGALSAQRITPATAWRNGALLAAAIVVTAGGRTGVIETVGAFTAEQLVSYLLGCLALCLAALAALLVRLARGGEAFDANPTSSVRQAYAPTGTGPWPVPDVEVTTAQGEVIALAAIAIARPTLALLVSAECTPCRQIIAQVPVWRQQLGDRVDIVLLTSEHPVRMATEFPELGVPVFYGYRALLTVTGLRGVPSALLLSPGGQVSAGPAEGLDDVVSMTEAIVGVVIDTSANVDPARARLTAR